MISVRIKIKKVLFSLVVKKEEEAGTTEMQPHDASSSGEIMNCTNI